MDARLWHLQAKQAPTPLPVPVANFNRLSEAERDAAIMQLRAALSGLLLPSELSGSIAQQMSQVVDANYSGPPGSKTIISLTAPFAAGKSTLITSWARSRHLARTGSTAAVSMPTWAPDPGVVADLVPVVYLSLISAAGIKELNAQILTFLGYPGEGVARVTTSKVTQALRIHGVKVLILDDAHMLRLTDKSSRQVLDYLKSLNSELGFLHATMVLVGAELEHTPILDDPQIRGRLRLFTLSPAEISSLEGRRRWQRFLKSAEALLLPHLPTCPPTALSSQHASFIWQRSQGYLGDATALMCGGLLNALARRARTITLTDLEQVPLSQRAMDGQVQLSTRRRRGKHASASTG
ncbi:MAG: TniB family NTP-binding protein [Arachnia sp.]